MHDSSNRYHAEIALMLRHQKFSERLILLLIAFAVVCALAGWPKVWSLFWVIPFFGYFVGRFELDRNGLTTDYWLPALGSQAILAMMVGVPIAVQFGF